MMSKNKTQIITINILPDISKSKANQPMKTRQLSWEIFFFEKPCRKWAREISSRPFLFFIKALYMRQKQVFSSLIWINFCSPPFGHTIKVNCIKFRSVDPHVCTTSFSVTFVYDFSKKLLLMLYSINWPNVIVWLPWLLEILRNTWIVIIYSLVYDVIDYELALISSKFYTCPKNQEKKLSILRTKRALKVK